MNVLVFGGNGFLGSHVVDKLLDSKHDVTVFDHSESKYIRDGVQYVIGDYTVFDQVKNIFKSKKFDIVYNFAGISDLNLSFKEPGRILNTNISGMINIMECLREQKVKRVLLASTVYVYSNKGSFYGVSKKCCEKILEEYSKEFKIPYTIIRFGSVYGPRSNDSNRVYRILKEAIEKKRITFKGDGEEVREYIHVRDAAKLSIDILDEQYENKSLILTGLEKFKYSELLTLVNEIMGGKIKIDITDEKYKGHYQTTPYSFSPTTGEKLVANPFTDFGQGIIELIEEIEKES